MSSARRHAPIFVGASRAIYEAVPEGVATSDLGGDASTSEFTDAVIAKVKTKLDVWGTI